MTGGAEQFKVTPDFLNGQRRLYERFPSRFPVKYKDSRNDFGTNVHLRNVSAEGAKITTHERVYLNDSVSIEVELPDGKRPMPLRGEVVWTHKQGAEIWDVGLKFHKVVFMDLWRICESAEINAPR